MQKKTMLILAALTMALAACQSSGDNASKNETSYMHLKTQEAFEGGVIGKTLNLSDGDSVVIAKDGTWAGSYKEKAIGGTWKFVDGYWCRTITDGKESCQQFAMASTFDSIKVTRDMGKGKSFMYTIGK